MLLDLGLLGAGEQARLDHRERREVAELERPVDRRPGLAGDGIADRHPLEIRLERRRLALFPAAFGLEMVVGGAVDPAVIGGLVIVPHRDHRRAGVHRLGIRIGLVLRVTAAIVVERHDVVRRIDQPADLLADVAAKPVAAVLVDVVAQV